MTFKDSMLIIDADFCKLLNRWFHLHNFGTGNTTGPEPKERKLEKGVVFGVVELFLNLDKAQFSVNKT